MPALGCGTHPATASTFEVTPPLNRHAPARPAQPSPRPHHPARLTPVGLRPQPWQRLAVYATVGGLWFSGVLWLVLHDLMTQTSELGVTPHPWAASVLKLHGVLAYVFLLVLGSLGTVHIPQSWRLQRHRVSGSSLVMACTALLVSALLLYYGLDDTHATASLLHWVIGLMLVPGLWMHVWGVRQRRKQPL